MKELGIKDILIQDSKTIKPIIVEADDKNEYILKTRHNSGGFGYKDFGIFLESISYGILKELKFEYTPKIVILNIDDDFIEDIKDDYEDGSINVEIYENIINSKGLNIGIENIDAVDLGEMEIKNTDFINKTLHIDSIIMNSDRTVKNTNILQGIEDDEYYLIDFDASFDNQEVIGNIIDNNSFNKDEYYSKKTFNEDYLFSKELKEFNQKPIYINEKKLNSIVDKTPKDWDSSEHKDKIVDIISNRSKSSDIFGIRDE